MKVSSKILGITLGVLTLGVASCSSDLNESDLVTPGQDKGLLVKAPKITAWSGNQTFGNTSTKAADEIELPGAVTSAEIEAAKKYFSTIDNFAPGAGTLKDISVFADWESYYVQDVANGNKLPSDIAMYVDPQSEVYNIAAWDLDADEVLKLLKTDEYLTSDKKVALTGLDTEGSHLVAFHSLKDFTFENKGVDAVNTPYEGIRSCGHLGNYSWMANYKIAEVDGCDGIFVAFYGTIAGNNGFWDRIVKITKVDLPRPEEGNGNGNVGDNGDDNGDDNGETGDNGGNGDVNNGPIVSDKILHNNEVEVNLSLQDVHENYSAEDLISKLSVHVRHAGDVKVRIPVPAETLVPADDLAIVLAHPELLQSYGKEHKATFMIGDNLVELAVDFTEAQDCAGNGYGYYIELTTKGINQKVVDYCLKNYGDGVNFEVWNYYQWNKEENGVVSRRQPTLEEINDLKFSWLDSSTVEFGFSNDVWNAYTSMLDLPFYYINAFNNDRDRVDSTGGVNTWDCHVKVIGHQDFYENLFEGAHLNGSNYNVIYVRDDIFGTDKQDDAHTEHPLF